MNRSFIIGVVLMMGSIFLGGTSIIYGNYILAGIMFVPYMYGSYLTLNSDSESKENEP